MKCRLPDGGRTGMGGSDCFDMRGCSAQERDPHASESVRFKPKRTPFFKSGKDLKGMLNS